MFRHNNSWQQGSVNQHHGTPRSYVIKSSNGKFYRRKHIRPTKVKPKILPTEDNIDLPPNYPAMTTADPQPEIQTQQQTTPEVVNPYVTRSGRTVKPPNRYGYSD